MQVQYVARERGEVDFRANEMAREFDVEHGTKPLPEWSAERAAEREAYLVEFRNRMASKVAKPGILPRGVVSGYSIPEKRYLTDAELEAARKASLAR